MNLKQKVTAVALGSAIALTGMEAASAASYTVKSGDTLFAIGQKHGVSYQSIMEENNLKTNMIYAGQKLEIGEDKEVKPNTSGDVNILSTNETYIVKSGDTLSKIAREYGTTYQKIMSLNNLDTTLIRGGQKLLVSGAMTDTANSSAASSVNSTTNSIDKVADEVKNVAGQAKLVSLANKYLGVKYTFGGASVKAGFDCSGLVYQVLKEAGKNVSRTTAAGYYTMSKKVSEPQIGDLVFFSGTYKVGISHVGIYIGNGKMISAAGNKVQYDSIHSGYWGKYFTGYGRI